MARYTEADILLQKNDLNGAAAKFGSIAQDQSLAESFRDLALIRQTAAEYDSLKPDVVISRLRGLAVKGGPWFGSALASTRRGPSWSLARKVEASPPRCRSRKSARVACTPTPITRDAWPSAASISAASSAIGRAHV